MNQRDLFTDQATPSHKNPLAVALAPRCQRCDCTEHVDVRLKHAPHNGQSVRRDCARCGWTIGFPVWYGKTTEATE